MADSDKPLQSVQPGQVISPGSAETSSQSSGSATPSATPASLSAQPSIVSNATPVQSPSTTPAPAEQAAPQVVDTSPRAATPQVATESQVTPPTPAQTPASVPQQSQPAPETPRMAAAPAAPEPQSATIDQEAEPEIPGTITPVSWTASEFIAHEKTPSWYAGLLAVTVVLSAAVYVITRGLMSTIVVVVCALMLGVLANRKPRQLQYGLSAGGITIGSKHFGYDAFKSFSVMPEGAFSSIVLNPLKRFAPLTTIYYAPEDEEKILDVLANFLPLQERRPDAIDAVAQRLRF